MYFYKNYIFKIPYYHAIGNEILLHFCIESESQFHGVSENCALNKVAIGTRPWGTMSESPTLYPTRHFLLHE